MAARSLHMRMRRSIWLWGMAGQSVNKFVKILRKEDRFMRAGNQFIKMLVVFHVVVVCLLPAKIYAGTIYAKSASYSDVSYAVSQTKYGDTVIVPPGKENWSSELVIGKYITLMGAGIGQTIISNTGINDTRKGIIKYAPDAISRGDDGLFRVTGMTFRNTGGYNHDNSSKGILLSQSAMTTHLFNIRIDNCSFYDFCFYSNKTVGNSPSYYGAAIMFYRGMWFGLIDNCKFYGPNAPQGIMGICAYEMGQTDARLDYPVSLGTEKAIYVEDCYFDDFFRNIASAHGARYVFRFNQTDAWKYDSWANIDAHGTRSPPAYSPVFPDDPNVVAIRGTMQAEAYLNKIGGAAIAQSRFWQLRGGSWMAWGNQATSTSDTHIVTLQDDDYSQLAVPMRVRSGGQYYVCKLNHTSSSGNQPPNSTYWTLLSSAPSKYRDWETGANYRADAGYDPHIGYYWNNTVNGSPRALTRNSTTALVRENRDYWQYTSSFNGTGGMGVGTTSEMRAFSNPAPGVGFWVTDEGAWNQSGGSNVLRYSGQGRFYRGNNSRKWELYYEPLSYPHPLREESPADGSGKEEISPPQELIIRMQ
jgi:hypothetical protein